MHSNRNAGTQDNPLLSCTWKMLMKNYNDRISSVSTSLRTNSRHAAFSKRQMKIIEKKTHKDSLWTPSSPQ